ncbi:unnamed protein product [Albugo candida]|uniref:Uncharacterized protein n=1 Tax=Albugo candida TaxID=65357 RepID=A0A024GFH7_9STRA|nr:unnamed protein product [Albugo candida]|eukprot:CCI45097.1 unnamed protein product [Albugo candida]
MSESETTYICILRLRSVQQWTSVRLRSNAIITFESFDTISRNIPFSVTSQRTRHVLIAAFKVDIKFHVASTPWKNMIGFHFVSSDRLLARQSFVQMYTPDCCSKRVMITHIESTDAEYLLSVQYSLI